MSQYRPWGNLHWMLQKLPGRNWSLFGGISSEERCLTSWETLKGLNLLTQCSLLRIRDNESTYLNECEVAIDLRQASFIANGGVQNDISQLNLLSRESDIVEAVRHFGSVCGPSLVIDISSLPKRFFFLVIRLFLANPDIQNVIVTCTLPERYAPNGAALAEDPEPWRHLPGFMPPYPRPDNSLLVVAIGYEPLGLPQIFESDSYQGINDVRLLFPFPSNADAVRKNWSFIRELSRYVPNLPSNINAIDPLDVSGVFAKLMSMSGNGSVPVVLAPFGPKTISLAMCLFAISTQKLADVHHPPATVFYTQPKTYNPQYSQGVKRKADGTPETLAYLVRSNGTDLF